IRCARSRRPSSGQPRSAGPREPTPAGGSFRPSTCAPSPGTRPGHCSRTGEAMPQVEFKANGSTASGYLAVPDSGSGPGVVVLQEWWGLDDHIRSVCDRLAADGFVALAPDLYHGETTQEPDEAQQKMM